MLTVLCPKSTWQKLYHVECSNCFTLQCLLLVTKRKGGAYERCMHFLIAQILWKGSASLYLKFKFSHNSPCVPSFYFRNYLFHFPVTLSITKSTCKASRCTSTKRSWILLVMKNPGCPDIPLRHKLLIF